MIPALNEARNLKHVFERMPADVHEVILVDGHSVDDTIETAQQLWPSIRIVRQTRAGKGNALACGFAAATGDVIATVDADGSADPREITPFVAALLDGAAFAKGSRFIPGGGSDDITRLRRLGNRVLTEIFNACYHRHYSDLCYGFNAFWREHLPALHLDATSVDGGRRWGDGFEIETVIHVRMAKAGLPVMEIPSFEHARRYGVSNLRALSDGLRVLRAIFVERRLSPQWRTARSQPEPRPSFAVTGGSAVRRQRVRLPSLIGASTVASALLVGGVIFTPTARQDHAAADINATASVRAAASPTHHLVISSTAAHASIFGGAKYRLVFHPRFSGQHLNTKVWATCFPWSDVPTGCTNFGNGEYQWFLPGQDRVSHGLLNLVAQRRRTTGYSPTGKHLVYRCRSGMVTTFKSFQFQYGIVQIVAKMPAVQGMWPALWLAAANKQFPPEVDIIEHWVRPVRPTGVFLHAVGGRGAFRFIKTRNLAVGWHTFSLTWTKTELAWFVDGRRVLLTHRFIPHQLMYLIADNADARPTTRGGCGGSLIIRSVKIWQR